MKKEEHNLMSKKLRDLLDQINGLKKEIYDLADAGSLDEAEEKKKELVNLQKKFDLLKDIEDNQLRDAAEAVERATGGVIPVDETSAQKAEKKFAAAFRGGFHNGLNEGTGADGGYTVPEDIETRIRKYREAKASLRDEVEVVPVTTLSGSRTYQKRSQHRGFQKVGEGGKIGKKNAPQFERLDWKVDKYGGFYPVTNELLKDSDANITRVMVEWIGEEGIATDNYLIIEAATDGEAVVITGLDDIKYILNVVLGQAFKPTSKVYTNDDGLQWLDTLKDRDGKYLLTADPHTPMQYTLSAGATKVPLRVYPNDVMVSDTETEGVRKIPFVIGDLKEGIALFDRQKTTLKLTDTASAGDFNAFEEDLTLIRAIQREDIEIKDADAFVYCTLELTDATVGEAPAEHTYTAVENPEGDPSALGYYVLNDGEYVLTEDTEVQSGTTYYTRN